jgi:predicted FMN-binding regulatory protein PaiB
MKGLRGRRTIVLMDLTAEEVASLRKLSQQEESRLDLRQVKGLSESGKVRAKVVAKLLRVTE